MSHRAALVDYASRITGSRTQAEDLVQEAFVRVATAGTANDAKPDLSPSYFYRVVRNLAIDWTRQRTRERRQQGEEPAWWMLPDAPRTPEQELLHRRNVDRVSESLAGLTPEARQAVEMHRFGGHTLAEIAEKLNVSVPTAHRLVRNALVRIARHLGPEPEE